MSKDAWTLVLPPLLPAMTEGVSLALAFCCVCSMRRDETFPCRCQGSWTPQRHLGLGRMEEGEVSSFSSSQQLGFNMCLTLALLAEVFFEERLP